MNYWYLLFVYFVIAAEFASGCITTTPASTTTCTPTVPYQFVRCPLEVFEVPISGTPDVERWDPTFPDHAFHGQHGRIAQSESHARTAFDLLKSAGILADRFEFNDYICVAYPDTWGKEVIIRVQLLAEDKDCGEVLECLAIVDKTIGIPKLNQETYGWLGTDECHTPQAPQSKARQSKARQSKARQSKAKQSMASMIAKFVKAL